MVYRYLHRGKLRCRRWMVSTMIPRTRELLMHVRQLSQLAVDDPDARARARRCKRLLKVRPPHCSHILHCTAFPGSFKYVIVYCHAALLIASPFCCAGRYFFAASVLRQFYAASTTALQRLISCYCGAGHTCDVRSSSNGEWT